MYYSTNSSNSPRSLRSARRWGARLFRVCAFVSLTYALTFCERTIYRISPLICATSFLSDPSGETTSILSLLSSANAATLLTLTFTLLSAIIVLTCAFKRRFFCRFICPLGAALDFASLIRRKLFKSTVLKHGLSNTPKQLAIFFSTLWIVSYVPLVVDDIRLQKFASITPAVFDPLVILSRSINYFPTPSAVFVAFIICFLVSPYFWRFRFCPCGLFQELLYLPCRLVKKFKKSSSNKLPEGRLPTVKTNAPSRRRFLTSTGALAFGIALARLLPKYGVKIPTRFFRPPGAFEEEAFVERCARCGKCISVCPTHILRPIKRSDVNQEDATSLQTQFLLGTPKIDFQNGYCDENCVACTEVCPTHALKLLSKESKRSTPIALVSFNVEKCMLYYDRECSICRRECPYEAIDFVWSDDVYANIPTIDESKCVGCGRCVTFCPGEPIVSDFTDSPNSSEAPSSEEDEKQSYQETPVREKALSLVMRSANKR